jgi:hypothetical protein
LYCRHGRGTASIRQTDWLPELMMEPMVSMMSMVSTSCIVRARHGAFRK